jgi:O-methyltransferase
MAKPFDALKQAAKKIPFVKNAFLRGHMLWQTAAATGLRPGLTSLILRVRPNTMVPAESLRDVYEICEDVERRQLPGAFVECGVWKGGCSAVMAYAAQKNGSRRVSWLFDSFKGLPEPGEKDGGLAHEYSDNRSGGRMDPVGKLVASEKDVADVFARLGIDPALMRVRKGWFQDTLPAAKKEIGPIAVLRMDGDWYESTIVCFENLYDLVAPGGYVIVDDYGYWEGCKTACDEFFAKRGIQVKMEGRGASAKHFQKPPAPGT